MVDDIVIGRISPVHYDSSLAFRSLLNHSSFIISCVPTGDQNRRLRESLVQKFFKVVRDVLDETEILLLSRTHILMRSVAEEFDPSLDKDDRQDAGKHVAGEGKTFTPESFPISDGLMVEIVGDQLISARSASGNVNMADKVYQDRARGGRI